MLRKGERFNPLTNEEVPIITADMDLASFKKAAKIIFKLSDNDGDGTVDFDEFIRLYMKINPKSPFRYASQQRWYRVYQTFDQNKNGLVTFKEAWKVFKKREKFQEDQDNFQKHIPGEPKIVWTMSISAFKRAC